MPGFDDYRHRRSIFDVFRKDDIIGLAEKDRQHEYIKEGHLVGLSLVSNDFSIQRRIRFQALIADRWRMEKA
jgi:hypothetical protein